MPSPVARASRVARKSRLALAGEFVTITRGDATGDEILATVGETRVEEYASDGSVLSVRYRDFFIDRTGVNAYQFGDGVAVPVLGDRITQSVGGETVTFEVTPAISERGAKRSDRRGSWWRIHTKEVDTTEGVSVGSYNDAYSEAYN